MLILYEHGEVCQMGSGDTAVGRTGAGVGVVSLLWELFIEGWDACFIVQLDESVPAHPFSMLSLVVSLVSHKWLLVKCQ